MQQYVKWPARLDDERRRRAGAADAEPTIAVQVGALRGQVVASSDRRRLAGVRVEVRGGDEEPLTTARTDPDGRFALPFVAAGEWTVAFTRAGAAPGKHVAVRIAAGGAHDLGVVEL